jgi:type IV secretory pathway TraG/TraD family ATPase VirD4
MPNHYKLFVLGFLALLVIGAVAVAGQYAGGMAFAKLQKIPEAGVNVFTLHDYWQAYGEVKAVKKSLAVCTLLSIAIPLVPVLLIVLLAIKSQGKFFQFGNAKFATRRDIKAVGLLED